tara:strand:+ start:344 stop:691 length:348 start_codon:yes stop_codon:yes gene_type:complete
MMNMQQILGESGRTMSNMDRNILANIGQTRSIADVQAMMSDNEPRMEDRDQVFSIEADIQNLMKSYNMLVEAQEFDRAQQVADQINMLDVQKTQIQAQNVPQQEDISSLLNSISI